MKSKMIGAWSIDATSVYLRPDHELHRQWVALMDDEDEDVGVQGYLKLSYSSLVLVRSQRFIIKKKS